MGLSIDSMQQQAILVGTHSLSLTLRECLSHKNLYAQYLSSELSRISIRPYCLTISIYFITHFGISKVLFFYGIINTLGLSLSRKRKKVLIFKEGLAKNFLTYVEFLGIICVKK